MSIFNATRKYETVKLRPEDELLLCCARTNVNSQIKDKILFLIQKEMEWDYLLNSASRHRLLPLLYHNLNSICPELVPEDILGKLKDYFNVNVHKNLLLLSELSNILNSFYSNNLNVFTYKGITLAILAYGNIALRDFNDIDIFVNLNETKVAFRLLKKRGYRSVLPLMMKKGDLCSKYHRAQVFFNENRTSIIDIQWNLSFIYSKSNYLSHFSSKNLKKLQYNGFVFNTLKEEDLFLVLSIHNASHMWKSLSLIFDIGNLVLNCNINWDIIILRATELKTKRILLINLLLINNFMDNIIPPKVLNKLLPDKKAKRIAIKIEKRLLTNKNDQVFNDALLQFQIREDLNCGLRDIMYLIFNPTEEDYQTVAIPNFLFCFYFLIRPFNLIKKFLV